MIVGRGTAKQNKRKQQKMTMVPTKEMMMMQLVSMMSNITCDEDVPDNMEQIMVEQINKIHVTDDEPAHLEYIQNLLSDAHLNEVKMFRQAMMPADVEVEEERTMPLNMIMYELGVLERGIVMKHDKLAVKEELTEEQKSGLMIDYVLGYCDCTWMKRVEAVRYVRWAVDEEANEDQLLHENWNTFGYLHIETLKLNVLKAIEEARAELHMQ